MLTRRHISRGLGLATALALAACSNPAPISSNPAQSQTNLIAQVAPQAVATVQQGLTDAQWNLQQAVSIGVLPASDPALACVNGVVTQLGVGSPAASFTPKESDLISTGSVVYIQIQQAKQLAGGKALAVPAGCQQLIGMFVIDASSLGVKGLSGGGLLPTLTTAP